MLPFFQLQIDQTNSRRQHLLVGIMRSDQDEMSEYLSNDVYGPFLLFSLFYLLHIVLLVSTAQDFDLASLSYLSFITYFTRVFPSAISFHFLTDFFFRMIISLFAFMILLLMFLAVTGKTLGLRELYVHTLIRIFEVREWAVCWVPKFISVGSNIECRRRRRWRGRGANNSEFLGITATPEAKKVVFFLGSWNHPPWEVGRDRCKTTRNERAMRQTNDCFRSCWRHSWLHYCEFPAERFEKVSTLFRPVWKQWLRIKWRTDSPPHNCLPGTCWVAQSTLSTT